MAKGTGLGAHVALVGEEFPRVGGGIDVDLATVVQLTWVVFSLKMWKNRSLLTTGSSRRN